MLGIIGAMEVEVATLKSAINNLEVTKKAGMEFCMGNIFGKSVFGFFTCKSCFRNNCEWHKAVFEV